MERLAVPGRERVTMLLASLRPSACLVDELALLPCPGALWHNDRCWWIMGTSLEMLA